MSDEIGFELEDTKCEVRKVPLFSGNDLIGMGAMVGGSENRKAAFDRVKKINRMRNMMPPPKPGQVNEVFDPLIENFPNFTEVIEYLRAQAVLRNRSKSSVMGCQPILLTGDPGIGKTVFAETMAAALLLDFHVVDMASMTGVFELTGGSSQWAESRHGRIFEILLSGNSINPVILFDEIEKAPRGHYPVHGAMFRILNPQQSKRFVDEAMSPLAIDASRVIYILTANSTEDLHPAIVDRCVHFKINAPSPEHAIKVAKSVWRSLRNSEDWTRTFDEELGHDALEALSMHTPRQMRMCLEDAMSKSALRGDSAIRNTDIKMFQPSTRRIGF